MNSPISLKKFSADYIAQRNHVYRQRVAIPSLWLQKEWWWTPRRLSASSLSGGWIEAEWGNARVFAAVPAALMEDCARNLLNTGALPLLPPALQLAVGEAIFSELADQIEASSRRPLRLVSMNAAAPDLAGMEGIEWELRSEPYAHTSELWMEPAGIKLLGAVFHKLSGSRTIRLDLSALPIPVRICVGWTTLRMHALGTLATRDVILLDESWVDEGDTVTIALGRNTAFRGSIRGALIEVTEGLTRIMEDVLDDDSQESGNPLDDLPVRLSFDLGERTLSLHELQTLAPGFTFDLGRDVRQAVQIRANGMLVGDGELVDIDGRIGVVVTSLVSRTERLN
jgi:type III secretion protein Q